MIMRTLIDMAEAKTFGILTQNGEVHVWENPSESALKTLQQTFGELRGFTLPSGSFWVWQAIAATHQSVRLPNVTETDAHFYISKGGNPADIGWTLGTWAYTNNDDDLTMWIDRSNIPSRLKAIFHEPPRFTAWPSASAR
jgi:hypothetical protein